MSNLVVSCAVFAAYQPPVGIPAPAFGIEETHRIYEGRSFDYDQNGIAEALYKSSTNGPYTHYIDCSMPKATDVNNPYGTVDMPRRTIPKILPAGSVVELHNGPYFLDTTATGKNTQPVFIRGISTNSLALLTNSNPLKGSTYLVLENLDFAQGTHLRVRQTCHHIAVRYCEFRDTLMAPEGTIYGAAISLFTDSAWLPGETIADLIIFRNKIHDNGDYPNATEGGGQHGILTGRQVERLWILENEIYYNAEDGIQVYGGGTGDTYGQFIYIGRNNIYENNENAVDLKQCYDVVVSENDLWGYRKTLSTGGSDGSAVVLNNDSPSDRLWIINNKIHDSTTGIRSQASGSIYILGNEFCNIKHEEGQTLATSTGNLHGVGLGVSVAANCYAVNNTFYDVDGGIYVNNGGNYFLENNIISNIRETNTYHLALNITTSIKYNLRSNLLYQPNILPRLKGPITSDSYIVNDPLFMDTSPNTFTLSKFSPAVASGVNSDAYSIFKALYGISIARDRNGIQRPQDIQWDIGAYELSAKPKSPVNLRILNTP